MTRANIFTLQKYFILLFFFLILLAGCAEEETKLEIFSPEAYAFPMKNGWELNGSFRVKGLEAEKVDNEFQYDAVYSMTLTDSHNRKRILFIDAVYKERVHEKLSDIGIDFQTEMDTSYLPGKYHALVKIKDNFSRKTAQLKFDIELSAN